MHDRLVEILRACQRVLDARGLRWYVFGAKAVAVRGVARFSADLDLTVELPEGSVDPFVADFAAAGMPLRVPDTAGFVARTRVLPFHHTVSGVPVDVVLAGPGLETLFLERAGPVDFGGVVVPVASAEDLVVMKILAGRPKDQDDALGILRTQQGALRYDQVRETLRMLEEALSQSDLLPAFEVLASRTRRSPA